MFKRLKNMTGYQIYAGHTISYLLATVIFLPENVTGLMKV